MASNGFSAQRHSLARKRDEDASERILVDHGDIQVDMTGFSGTMARELWPLMLAEDSIRLSHCPCCGRWLGRPDEPGYRGQMHHVVYRSAGELHDRRGRKLRKTVVSLCGTGNSSGCHGLAHGNGGWLHFRVRPRVTKGDWHLQYTWSGVWDLELLATDEPDYQRALLMDGWRRVR